jgi:DNA-binding GntR family transcriptional regulator
VAETAGNAYLSLVVGPMLRRAQWVFQQTASHRAPHSWTEHLGLYEAIAEGDEGKAEARAVAHVEAARRSYLSALAKG